MLICLVGFLGAQAQSTVSTFHNISLYWSPVGGSANKKVLVQFKEVNENDWQEALPMKYNPIPNCGINPKTNERYDKADYRGSIVNLTPGTTYDIELTLEGTNTVVTLQASTWSEEFPIAQTIVVPSQTGQYNIDPRVGTPNGYILIDGTGSTIDVNNLNTLCIKVRNSSYVIIRGFTLKGAKTNAIQLYNSHHIVIEDCDISGWGEEDVQGSGFGVNYQAAIYGPSYHLANLQHNTHNIIVQRNKIHDPRYQANSWAQLHDPNADPDVPKNYHPEGPQGVALGMSYIGNNVIRYNEFWSSEGHYFNDILGQWENSSYTGFPGADSDIYGNYIANCYDDGIEAEGGNMNVRIWNNYITDNLIQIANAATSIGPLYIWRNVLNHNTSPEGSIFGVYGPAIKLGHAGHEEFMTGQTYIFNNTLLQPNGEGPGGLGTSTTFNRIIKHCQSRNNILEVRPATTNSISVKPGYNVDIDFDYDLMNKGFPNGHEANGISNSPIYAANAPVLDINTMTGNFQLAQNSPGLDAGVIIPNFIPAYNGNAPDMGAHEAETADMVFGVNASFLVPLPAELVYFKGKDEGYQHVLSWVTASEIHTDYFVIEHSTDLEQWQEIAHLDAAQNSLGQQHYVFRYKDFKTNNYYRLKAVDLDGFFEYSNIISLAGKKASVRISPNPAKNTIKLDNASGNINIKIFTTAGNLIYNKTYDGQSIDISLFPKGMYYLKFDGHVETFTKQ